MTQWVSRPNAEVRHWQTGMGTNLSHELHHKSGQGQENSGIIGCPPHTSNVFENDTEIGNWKTGYKVLTAKLKV